MPGAVRGRRDAGRDHGAAVGAATYSSSVTCSPKVTGPL
jgi:hypothetical protein